MTEITSISNTDPSLTSAALSFSSQSIGDILQIYVKGINSAGSVTSDALLAQVGAPPIQPLTPPYSDDTVTDTTRLKIMIDPLVSSLQSSSELVVNPADISDNNENAIVIQTTSPSVVLTNGIERGLHYLAKYRYKTFNGYGPWSDTSLIIAATKPSQPPPPTCDLLTSDSTKIVFNFLPPDNDGGYEISEYRLYMEDIVN
jgi:hypothetical protein